VDALAHTWKDKLNEAYSAGFNAPASDAAGDMDVDGSSSGSDDFLLRVLGAKQGDILIDMAVVPSWEPATLVKRIRVPSRCTLSKLQAAISLELRMEVRLCLDKKTLDGNYVRIEAQHQLDELFREYIGRAGRTPVVVWAEPCKDSLFSPEQLGLPSNRARQFDAIGLQAKGIALRDLQKELEQEGRVINAQLLGDFYEYFRQQGASEVTVDQFMACMTSSKLGFSPTSARALFHGFDTDGSSTLSLKEIGVGLAKLTQGSVDEKLMLMFQAYDTDNNGYLDVNELSNLIHVASGVPIAAATSHASAVIDAVDKNGDRRLDVFEFRDAAFKQMLPLALLWSEGKVNNYSGGRDNRRQDGGHNNRDSGDSSWGIRRSQSDGGGGRYQHQRDDHRGGGGRKRGHSPTGARSRGHSPTGRGNQRGNSPTWQRGRSFDDNDLRRPPPRPVGAQRRNNAGGQQKPNPFSSR
jgi:Ca2+-binding EF-hand superfamily protein